MCDCLKIHDGANDMKRSNVWRYQNAQKSNANILVPGSLVVILAMRLLDKRIREGAHLFYCWYRHCEDVSRNKKSDCEKLSHGPNVFGWFDRLQTDTYAAIFQKAAVEPAFEAIERAVSFHGWPISVMQDVLKGFAMDIESRAYKTVSDLMVYCYGVAGSVSVGMAEIFGVDVNDLWMMDRACDLGIAVQLTNIARHVMDDAKQGRVYLPAELFLSGRASPDFILDAANRSAVIAATNVLLDLADEYYASADVAIGYLPWRVRWVTAMAASSCRVIANHIRWSDDPWPVKQPAQFCMKLLNMISFYGELVFNSLTPFRFNADRIDLWTRSAHLNDRNWGGC
jgi:phytoene synthase